MALVVDDLVAQCATMQEDEITVIESIYPTLIDVHPNPSNRPGRLLTLELPISLPSKTIVQLDTSTGPSASLELTHLPPLNLRLLLPDSYPLAAPPKPIALRATLPNGDTLGNWLPKNILKTVQDKLSEFWAEEKEICGEGIGIIWKWWEWVANGDFLQDTNLLNDGILQLAVPPTLTPSTFHTMLKTYNASQIHSDFEQTAFSCSICLENRKGKSCVQMPGCGCVFCTPCLSSCWTLAITEGTLESVSCPSVSCVKQRALREKENASEEVDPNLIESIVGHDLRHRYEELKEQRKAEIDPMYTLCPRPTCQAAVPPPPPPTTSSTPSSSRVIRLSDLSPVSITSSEPPTPSIAQAESRWERYRICPKCNYSFCLYCSATWHGPHTPCAFPQTGAIVAEYLSYPEGSEGRRRMEARRGKLNIERMVAKWQEEEENRKWLEGKTRACAGCGVRVEKSHGCNHMTCGRCGAHFCYRCGNPLKPSDPYVHYNTPGQACYMKLFDQEEVARIQRETAGGAGAEAGGGDGEWQDVRGFWEW